MNLRSRLVHIGQLFFVFLLLNISACSDPQTPEQQVHQFIDNAVTAVETRKTSDFIDLIDDDYKDDRGNDKKMIGRTAFAYLLGNSHIYIFTQVKSIHFPNPQQADVQLYAAMTASRVNAIDALFNIRAELFLFELKLVNRDDEWQLNNARWHRVNRQDLKGD